jgi:hypothetical protein
VYQEEKLLLQYMQSGGLHPTESCLLKTPPHMENIDMRWRTGRMLARNVELRRQYLDEPKRFIDFPMTRMVRDPMSCVQEIYEFFGIELTDQTHRKMQRFMDERGMQKRKPNVYDAADYGLDIDELWPHLQFYRDFYGIEVSRER